jgi:hypothetical protein
LYSNIFEQNLRIEVGEGRELQTFRSIFRRKEEMEMKMDGEKERKRKIQKDIKVKEQKNKKREREIYRKIKRSRNKKTKKR